MTEKAPRLPQGWKLNISEQRMAESAVSGSNTVLCTKPYVKNATLEEWRN
jgi:hypothetical protein